MSSKGFGLKSFALYLIGALVALAFGYFSSSLVFEGGDDVSDEGHFNAAALSLPSADITNFVSGLNNDENVLDYLGYVREECGVDIVAVFVSDMEESCCVIEVVQYLNQAINELKVVLVLVGDSYAEEDAKIISHNYELGRVVKAPLGVGSVIDKLMKINNLHSGVTVLHSDRVVMLGKMIGVLGDAERFVIDLHPYLVEN